MGRLIICGGCGREREHEAFGLCKMCYNHDYYVRNRDDEISRVIQYQQQNPEKKREADRRYWEKHKDTINANRRKRYTEDSEYREGAKGRALDYGRRYPEKARQRVLRWSKENPEKVAVMSARRAARKRSLPNTLTNEQGELLLKFFPCFYCGSGEDLTLDHFVPLIRGGGTTRANMTVACKSCNSSKNSKLPEEIFVQLPLYLEENDENRRTSSD